MGRVRTKTVKRASRVLIEKGYHMLTLDFELNKRVASDIASIPSKRLRNKIAGYVVIFRCLTLIDATLSRIVSLFSHVCRSKFVVIHRHVLLMIFFFC